MSAGDEGIGNMTPQKRRAHLQALLRDKARRARRFPLSSAQNRMWLLDQLVSNRASYNQLLPLRLEGALEESCLRRTLEKILVRHESLRMSFGAESGTPYQAITEPSGCDLRVDDLTQLEAQERDARVMALASQERSEAFDLASGQLLRARLLRLSQYEYVLLLTVHHIAFDGWSRNLLMRELTVIYDAERRGLPAPLPVLEVQYADYAVWQREWLNSPACEQQLHYWQKRLRDLPTLDLASDRRRPPVHSFAGAMRSRTVNTAVWEGVHSLSRRAGVTPFIVLFAAFTVLMHRYSGQDDVVVGSPVANRNRSEIEGLVGCFVNSLVLRTDVAGDPTFLELLDRVKEGALEAYTHQDLPFDALVQVMEPKRDPSRNPLFQVMFALQADGSRSIEGEELRISVVPIQVETTRFDLECYLIPDAGTLKVQIVYSTELFDASTIDRMLAHFEHVLDRSISEPLLPVSRIDLLGMAERRGLLENSVGRMFENATKETLLSRFRTAVRRDPQAPALYFGNRSLSYGELDSTSNRIANHLRSLGAAVDIPVAVLLERSIEMVVAWLAVLKSGAAYLPMDPENPDARLQYMLSDSAATVLISNRSLARRVAAFAGNLLRIDEDAALLESENESEPAVDPAAESLAYLIYTSGSTGLPKGVAVEHRALANLIAWHNRVYAVKPDDRATQIAGLGFDATVWEVWPYLSAGASVHLVDEETRRSPKLLWRWLVENRITLTFVPTPMAEAMLRERMPEAVALRAMLTGGDRLSGGGLPQRLPFRLINHYGPTENAVVSTCAEVDLTTAGQIAPAIGRPIDNVQAFVLDAQMQPVPIGVTGELYLSGDSLARGYWRSDALTDERFVTNSFSGDADVRLYRSGDLVRWRADGMLEFVGRADQQVKIRGYRIELGEIESLLNGHPGIAQAVVNCQGEEDSSKRLLAYIVKSSPALSLSEVRDELRERLPSYMLPSVWIELDTLPLTPNGKVDRAALPAPQENPDEALSYTAPRSDIERHVAGIWCELLGLERVSVDDNFFDLGGHSLVASQVVSRIRDELQIDMMLSRFFTRPTVAGLAEQIQIAALTGTTENVSECEMHEEFRL